jgi:hypothetical protein
MIEPEKGNNNSILTGLTGLADRTPRLIEWLTSGEEIQRPELSHYAIIAGYSPSSFCRPNVHTPINPPST